MINSAKDSGQNRYLHLIAQAKLVTRALLHVFVLYFFYSLSVMSPPSVWLTVAISSCAYACHCVIVSRLRLSKHHVCVKGYSAVICDGNPHSWTSLDQPVEHVLWRGSSGIIRNLRAKYHAIGVDSTRGSSVKVAQFRGKTRGMATLELHFQLHFGYQGLVCCFRRSCAVQDIPR